MDIAELLHARGMFLEIFLTGLQNKIWQFQKKFVSLQLYIHHQIGDSYEEMMGETTLYKYLDVDGGLMMLYNSNLMFTNATQLNDPFDCHPVLRDLSATPANIRQELPGDVISQLEYQKGLMRRDKTYICSLSKVHNSILMWTYYTKHSGVCIGLDMEIVRKYTKQMTGIFLDCSELEVQYRDVVNKPSSIKDSTDFLGHHFATKAKEWQHEREVRLVAYGPMTTYMRLLPNQNDNKGPIPWEEVRAFLDIGGECFESVYLGVKINDNDKEKIIKVARKCNPDIKIYQMTIDSEAFRLKEEQIAC